MELERPVTPIDEEIRVPPPTFDKLCKLVRRRVAPRPKITSLSVPDQKELVSVSKAYFDKYMENSCLIEISLFCSQLS